MNAATSARVRTNQAGTAATNGPAERGPAAALRHAASLIFSAVREIFDESAYDRFLSRHSLRATRSSYLAFLQEQELTRSRRPRCC
jgi:hypothetical protein